ncbi:hypothetical protein CP532_0878 [Ophiocordyceps camponoti-leonardi (nom. inval.)]|nr:hypothetical protein CP532_0878 [Ophiocordyceps camponoti-leonardi (nom. inval.)]
MTGGSKWSIEVKVGAASRRFSARFNLPASSNTSSSSSSSFSSSRHNQTMDRAAADRVHRWLNDGNAPGAVPPNAQGHPQCRACHAQSLIASIERRPAPRCLLGPNEYGLCRLWRK